MTSKPHPFSEVRFRPTHAARAQFGHKACKRIADAAVADLHVRGLTFEPVFLHVFWFEGQKIALHTQIDKDQRGIFVEFDVGDGVPERTLTQADVAARYSKAAKARREAEEAFAEDPV